MSFLQHRYCGKKLIDWFKEVCLPCMLPAAKRTFSIALYLLKMLKMLLNIDKMLINNVKRLNLLPYRQPHPSRLPTSQPRPPSARHLQDVL